MDFDEVTGVHCVATDLTNKMLNYSESQLQIYINKMNVAGRLGTPACQRTYPIKVVIVVMTLATKLDGCW